MRPVKLGREFPMPVSVLAALERVFDVTVHGVKVVEHSLYARAHWGMAATTRRGLVLLTGSGQDFLRCHELILHEYFHVIRQWNTGRMTRCGYVAECIRRGYHHNRFESEARAFAADSLEEFRRFLQSRS